MNTQLLPAAPPSIALAARLLAGGQLVAFPTETVYGLGANALDRDAVLSIFAAKGRPADNPLIVHIHDRGQLDGICEVNDAARRLMDAFWPGPLTLILPRKEAVPYEVTAHLETVAVRMPSHPVAISLLKACGLPIAAPSANRSGKPSPTSAQHVLDDMDGRIPLILDGGACDVGLESTVLSLCGDVPCILRPGGITQSMLEAVIGKVEVAGSVLRPLHKGEKALSPGMMYKHYSPDGQVTLIEGEEADVVEALRRLHAHATAEGHRTCVMCFTEHVDALADCHPHDIGRQDDASDVAHRLFATLRDLDDEKMDVIFSEVVPPEGVGLAVMNRLGRAAAFRTVRAEEVLCGR
ncbi:MAG: threonylcarbamoyl-AMP synthase [Clostridia bacterium]|nr:threonylcarbamoyl-AMP synthase [Clostridia bacterium]